MPDIQRIDIPQLVKVRKYEVDCERLQQLLREQKKHIGKSNGDLSKNLSVPVTKVEHWFRTDSCFSIPDPDIWERLKAELEITTTEFDESITTFEERVGVYEKSERCYFDSGIAPTLTSTSAKTEKIIVGGYELEENKTTAAAMRGRKNGGEKHKLQVELSDREFANTITTAPKDSMVNNNLRIRKLTPKECFRLMGFDDSDFEKAEAVNSNSQLYKQAGNSIVVPVVERILESLISCGALI